MPDDHRPHDRQADDNRGQDDHDPHEGLVDDVNDCARLNGANDIADVRSARAAFVEYYGPHRAAIGAVVIHYIDGTFDAFSRPGYHDLISLPGPPRD